MLRMRAAGLLWTTPLIASLLLGGCSSEDKPADAPTAEKKAEKKEAKPAPEAAVRIEPAPPLKPAAAPQSSPLRSGAPVILAQFSQGALVPLATRVGTAWVVEEAVTLDKMPEGTRGKDAHPGVLVEWWKRLDVQPGDIFYLRGDRGAQGTFKIKHEFATADRGGCVGLVWALAGEVQWTVKPKGSTRGGTEEGPGEAVWAFRGGWIPKSSGLARELNPAELAGAKATLEKIRQIARRGYPNLPPETNWQECDSLSEVPCKAGRASVMPIDLEGDGVAEAFATIQLRPSSKEGKPIPGVSVVESRLLLGLTDKTAYVLGRWDGDSTKVGEEAFAPGVAGVLDISGDGRSEVIMRRVLNETENWEVFQATPEKPGTWVSLFKTAFEGC